MEKQYYTPAIGEFHVGFEYELLTVLNPQWEEVACDLECDDIATLRNDIKENFVRVKYLDRNDIESIGWTYKNTNGMCVWYNVPEKNEWFNNTIPSGDSGRYWDFELIHDPKYKTVKIKCLTNYGEWEVFFEGICKNKSELKKLMQQLNIIK